MPRLYVEMTRFSRDIDCQYFYEMAIALLDYQLSPTKNSPKSTLFLALCPADWLTFVIAVF